MQLLICSTQVAQKMEPPSSLKFFTWQWKTKQVVVFIIILVLAAWKFWLTSTKAVSIFQIAAKKQQPKQSVWPSALTLP